MISETSLTGRPVSLNDFAVPPDAINTKPRSCNLLPNDNKSVLSETLNSAVIKTLP